MLYQALFGTGDPTKTLATISAGIHRIVENAEMLLDDAVALADARRFESADFMVATAREEMAKIYILVDMCRLDFAKHEGELQRLCRAFYNHVVKHAYYELNAKSWPGIQEAAEFKSAFEHETQKWFPGAPYDEPDMPPVTYFSRESNLYVDWDDNASEWSNPRSPAKGYFFGCNWLSPLSDARKALDKLKGSRDCRLFEADRLCVLHSHFSAEFFDDKATTDRLLKLYQSVGAEIERRWGLPLAEFVRSEVHNWPLYAFVA